ncbi:uncharacterized protein [Watersipora subatra]|uniref:uncharacterized protein n=1 Tax=Watersipora subatra TaxID=2589382 RepID=UPI00355B1E53
MWTSKDIRSVYTNAGAVMNVEGNLEQVHPATLCSDKPQLTFGRIYLLKLDHYDPYPHQDVFCTSAADQASIAVKHGATAIILITTDRESRTAEELSQLAQPLERPVLAVREVSEEDKLLTILNSRESVYVRISPIALAPATQPIPLSYYSSQEKITYIGIAVIFSLILVLLAVAAGVILKLRNIRRKIQIQTRDRLLANFKTYKYKETDRRSKFSSVDIDSPSSCAICLERYSIGEDMRMLPCSHEYHRKCIDKWLAEHSTCPCCCGDINELLAKARRSCHSRNIDRYGNYRSSGTCCSHLCSRTTSDYPLSTHSNTNREQDSVVYTFSNMHELLLPKEHKLCASQQQEYLLHRLYEIKRQRPPSTTVSDTTEKLSTRLSVMSSSYDSTLDIDSSLPCENNFIGDSCQGGVPCRSDAFSSCDLEIGDVKCNAVRHFQSSKSTFPSVETVSMSPRVSEFDSGSSCKGGQILTCSCKRRHKMRTVRFREPESEVLSSTEDDMYSCACEPCRACMLRRSLAERDKGTSAKWSDSVSSISNNASENPSWNIQGEETITV